MSHKVNNPYIETILSRADIQNSGYQNSVYGSVIPLIHNVSPFNQTGTTLGNSQQIEHGNFLKDSSGNPATLLTALTSTESSQTFYDIPEGSYKIDYRIVFKVNTSPSWGASWAYDYFLKDMDAAQQLSTTDFKPSSSYQGFFTRTHISFRNIDTSSGITFAKSKEITPCITTAGSIEANRVLVDFRLQGIVETSNSNGYKGFSLVQQHADGPNNFSPDIGYAGTQSFYSKITKLS